MEPIEILELPERFRDIYRLYVELAPADKLLFLPEPYVINELRRQLPYSGIMINLFYRTYIAPKACRYITYFCGVISENNTCLSISKVRYTSDNYYWDEPYVHLVTPRLALVCISVEEINRIKTLDFGLDSVVDGIDEWLSIYDAPELYQIATFFPCLSMIRFRDRIGSKYVNPDLVKFVDDLRNIGVSTDIKPHDMIDADDTVLDKPITDRAKQWLTACREESQRPNNVGYLGVSVKLETTDQQEINQCVSDAIALCDYGYYVMANHKKDTHNVEIEFSWVLGAGSQS